MFCGWGGQVVVDLQHALYEALAPKVGYAIRTESEWEDMFVEAVQRASVELERNLGAEIPADAGFWRIARHLCRFLRTVAWMTQPRGVFLVALDGPAPAAKHLQQRQRRYLSASQAPTSLESVVQTVETKSVEMDTCAFSPGTPVMRAVESVVRCFLELWSEKPQESRGGLAFAREVVFLGSDVAGEGEHKMMDALRLYWFGEGEEKPKSWSKVMEGGGAKESGPTVVVGADSDLVVLSLTTLARARMMGGGEKERQIFVCRRLRPKKGKPGVVLHEDEKDGEKMSKRNLAFSLLDIGRLWTRLVDRLLPSIPPPTARDACQAILDLCALLPLIGNDFVPRLSSCKCDEFVMRKIFRAYSMSADLGPLVVFHFSSEESKDSPGKEAARTEQPLWEALSGMPLSWTAFSPTSRTVGINTNRMCRIMESAKRWEEEEDSTVLEGMAGMDGLHSMEGLSAAEAALMAEMADYETDTATDHESKDAEYYRNHGCSALSGVLSKSIPHPEHTEIESICSSNMAKAWWAMVQWVATCYILGTDAAGWESFYPYYFSPRASSIIASKPTEAAIAHPIRKPSKPPSAPEHLACVISPHSPSLLPPPILDWIRRASDESKSLYPRREDLYLDAEEAIQEYEAILYAPAVPLEIARKLFSIKF